MIIVLFGCLTLGVESSFSLRSLTSTQPFVKCALFTPFLFKIFHHFQIYQTKMSSQDNPDWCMLGQDLIFQKIMMMVASLDNLETLDRCEQVCTAWNSMIMQNIWESTSKRNIIKMRIEQNWAPGMLPSEEDISHAKGLGNNNTALL